MRSEPRSLMVVVSSCEARRACPVRTLRSQTSGRKGNRASYFGLVDPCDLEASDWPRHKIHWRGVHLGQVPCADGSLLVHLTL